MTQPTPPESSNNHTKAESLSFVKQGKLWIPATVKRRSLLSKFWRWTGFGEKRLWDVLQLLIVPTALAIGAFYLQETAKQRDLKIADDRAKQETLNRYFDQISTLLFEKKLRTAKEGSEARIVARARTLTALQGLDGKRKTQLVGFLLEAQLIQSVEQKKPVINLVQANLSEISLTDVTLNEIDLREANLSRAYLSRVSLDRVNLSGANLSEANFSNSFLGEADFTGKSQRSKFY